MKKHLQALFSVTLIGLMLYLVSVGIEAHIRHARPQTQSESVIEKSADTGWQLKEPTDSAEFISGPLVASVGELCVFRLNDPGTKADWIIVPPATCYIDSSGSSLAFASNVPATYTIIAAIVEDGIPKILTHICEYGISPEPTPNPSPTPNPTPTPPPANLTEWVTKNIPDGGQSQCAALASCYESAAEGIEKGSIRTTEAAFSAIRTATQTKIKPEIWGTFLDALAIKITEKMDGSNDVRKLGAIFSEIVSGLKAVSDTGDIPENEMLSEVLKLPTAPPAANCDSPSGTCPVPTVKPTPTYIRSRR